MLLWNKPTLTITIMSDDTRIHFSEGKISMNKKLILLMALLSGISVVAMDHIQERPVLQEASHHEEESRVRIRLTDSQDPKIPHEVEIPVHLAKLIGALNELVEEPALKDSVFPLPNVTIAIWRFIEPQLERVYGIAHDASQAAQLREALMTEFRKLDVKSLIGVICASEYLDIPLLLESACEVIKRVASDKILWEELEVLPWHIRNRIIMNKIVMPLPPHALCRGHEGVVFSVSVTEDNKIISGSRDNTVRVWDMEGNQLAVCRGHQDDVRSVCVKKDDKIVSGSRDKTVRVWDINGNQLAVCRGHEGGVESVCVTKDDKIVSGSWDMTVRVWDIDGNQLAVCRGHEYAVFSVCVTNDGKIISGSGDTTVRVSDMQGNDVAVCRGHASSVRSLCVTEDGKIVSGCPEERTVRVWDMQGNQLALCNHEGGVESVCVTKDGKIVSGSLDKTVRVWDMEGNQLAVCRGHERAVKLACITKDDKIVSVSWDDTLRVWDMEGNQLAECRGHEKVVTSVSVAKGGKVVSGSDDRTVRVWDSGLLDSIVHMDEDQAQTLWAYVRNLQHDVDQQTCWRQIEKILGEDAPVALANNNNIE